MKHLIVGLMAAVIALTACSRDDEPMLPGTENGSFEDLYAVAGNAYWYICDYEYLNEQKEAVNIAKLREDGYVSGIVPGPILYKGVQIGKDYLKLLHLTPFYPPEPSRLVCQRFDNPTFANGTFTLETRYIYPDLSVNITQEDLIVESYSTDKLVLIQYIGEGFSKTVYDDLTHEWREDVISTPYARLIFEKPVGDKLQEWESKIDDNNWW